MTDDRGEQLARLIEEAPEDLEAFRVYADWLEEQHDPRATLIRLQMTRARLTDRTKLDHLETRLAEYFEQHREHFLGPLAKVMPTAKSSRQARDSAPKLEWRNGFIYKANLARIKRMPQHQVLDHLLAHPSGRFLVSLGGIWAEDPAALVAVLAARAPRSLRRLDITGTDGRRVVGIEPLWPRLELLEEIEIRTVAGLGDIVLPSVRCAHIDISKPLLASLANARWPKLEQLRLRVWPETATAEELIAVFANELPALRAVELDLDHPTAAVLPMLSGLPVGRQLAELDVRISNDIVEALERCTFQLEVLRIHGHHYPDPQPRLQHLAKRIEVV
ncbi:MAG: TIGR02996 domain-containing protein [Deltaproteobacteria bacterium]|nr:TIGR02996 domain-containing protein [Deltaproteobacteria bacterium]